MVKFEKILSKGVQSALDRTPIINDRIRFTTDSGRLFIDHGGRRIEITDFCKEYTEDGIKKIVSPLPKVYISSDTNRMMVYDTINKKWTYIDAKNAETAKNASTAQYAVNASTANYSTNASTAQYAVNASTSYFASLATTANYSHNASTAQYALNATSAQHAVNASTADHAVKDVKDNPLISTYAPLASPLFIGKPVTPTPALSSNDNQIANTEFVNTAIKNALKNITGFDIKVLAKGESLPETGVKGVFYLVPIEGASDADNTYDEFIWNVSAGKYEHLGPQELSLDGYLRVLSIAGTGNAITGAETDGNTLVLKKDITFLTKHPSIKVNDPNVESSEPNAGTNIEVVENLALDENGHLIGYTQRTITLPNSVLNASTAQYAVKAKDATNASTANYAKNAPIFKGTTAGFVPNATTAQKTMALLGSGTWGNPANASTAQYAVKAKDATNASTANYAKNSSTATCAMNGVFIGNTAPKANTPYLLWVDTGNKGMMKYRSSNASTDWVAVPSVWS